MESERWRRGQSLVELLVGMVIGAIFLIGLATIITPSLETITQAGQVQGEAELANEMEGNLQSWAAGNWNAVLGLATGTANVYSLNTAVSPFIIASGTETISQTVNTRSANYLRSFYLGDVYRDSNGNVTTTVAGNNYDPSTKLVTVVVQASSTPAPAPFTSSFYLTRNGSNNFTQTSWAGGAGQAGPITFVATSFASSSNIAVTATGSIQLVSGGNSCVL